MMTDTATNAPASAATQVRPYFSYVVQHCSQHGISVHPVCTSCAAVCHFVCIVCSMLSALKPEPKEGCKGEGTLLS